jgi:hypothetical protein
MLLSVPAVHSANYVVTSTSIFGTGNLDQVLQEASAAPGPHTITFDPAILPATFTISTVGRKTINYDLTMTGQGADRVTLNFGGFSPGFEISAGRTVVFSGIKFANARVVGGDGAFGSFSAQPTPGGPGEGVPSAIWGTSRSPTACLSHARPEVGKGAPVPLIPTNRVNLPERPAVVRSSALARA